MIRREPWSYDDCYFCLCKVDSFNMKNRDHIKYPNVTSVSKPVVYEDNNIPPPLLPSYATKFDESIDVHNINESDDVETDLPYTEAKSEPQLFTQNDLNDLVRDLNLTKSNAELLGSRLKEKNLLAENTTFYWYRNRETECLDFFSQHESLMFCNNVPGLLKYLGVENYNPNDWRVCTDSSKRSLKAVLLDNGSQYASIPVAHSVHMKETYDNIATLLKYVKYDEHNWFIYSDLKIMSMILGQQSEYTKYSCFLCMWDSRYRSKHWTRKVWPVRKELIPGSLNVIRPLLVQRYKMLLPPLYIKLGLIKQFVKVLYAEGDCFKYLSSFPD